MNTRTFSKCGLGLATTFLLGIVANGQVTVDPPECLLDLDPGEQAVVPVTATIPGESGVAMADVYILADNTGSMGSVIASVQASASTLVGNLLGRTGVDIQVGIGRYQDFPFDAFAYEHQADISDDQTALVDAINTWAAIGGSDGSEGQFFALHQVATDAPGIGWRPGAKRIIVWFGDAPGHDPVCAAIQAGGCTPEPWSGTTVAESEPNDDAASADAAGSSDDYAGAIDVAFESDFVAFSALAGDVVSLATVLTGLSDSVLTLYDTDGVTPLVFDDDGGPGLASAITFSIPASGTYFAEVGGFGSSSGSYTLELRSCSPAMGPVDIDEALVQTELLASGPGGAALIAITTPTGFALGLNDDPTASAGDYSGICTIGGTAGQATRLATATGGVDTDINDPGQITSSILASIDLVLSMVDVSLMACGAIEDLGFVTDITPAVYTDVVIPSDPAQSVSVTFDVTFEGQPCALPDTVFTGELKVQIDGAPAASKPVTITQESCGCPNAAEVTQLGVGCGATLSATLPILGTVGTFTIDGDLPDAPGTLYFSLPGGSAVFQGCDVFLTSLFVWDAFVTDANGDATIATLLPTDLAACDKMLVFQAAIFGAGGATTIGDITNGLLVKPGATPLKAK